MAANKPRKGRGAKRTAAKRPPRTQSRPRRRVVGAAGEPRGLSRETGTFGGEACPECGAPYEVRRGPKSYERRAEPDDDGGGRELGPDEREPGIEDVERPSGASRRGNRGYEPDEPRRGAGPGRRSVETNDLDRPGRGEEDEGPSERRGGFGPRNR
jgi:hypothetical protein